MKTFRLIRSLPASAAANMAADREILARYLADGVPVLRVYRWQAPSFTCGVSQRPEDGIDVRRCALDGIEIAGRMTGGGILFHHDEITYSLACGKQDVGEPEGMLVSYRSICGFLLRFYESLGLKASFAVEECGFGDRCAPHQLCSASHEKYDIVIRGKKIGGNAQKRSRSAIFQHGSVPCRIDWGMVRRYAPSLPEDAAERATSLCEQMAVVPGKDVLAQKLIDSFGAEFNVRFTEEEGSLDETGVAQ